MNHVTRPEIPAAPAVMQGGELPDPDLPACPAQIGEKRRHPRYNCDGYAEVFLPMAGCSFVGGYWT
ncbi:MAG: hypothetical protein JOY95_03225 [Silvibacterium sp.]|nr:hypothetical protein [Silvibacterium sp.]